VLSKLDHRVLRRKKERKRINGEYPVSVSPTVLRVCTREFEHEADEGTQRAKRERTAFGRNGTPAHLGVRDRHPFLIDIFCRRARPHEQRDTAAILPAISATLIR